MGASFFATNNTPLGATFQPITNGFEFLMGTVTLTVTNSASANSTVNWAIPGFTAPALKGGIAIWTEADGVSRNGNTDFAEMLVGSPVALTAAVPEPTALALLALGTLGALGRPGRRRAGPGRRV